MAAWRQLIQAATPPNRFVRPTNPAVFSQSGVRGRGNQSGSGTAQTVAGTPMNPGVGRAFLGAGAGYYTLFYVRFPGVPGRLIND